MVILIKKKVLYFLSGFRRESGRFGSRYSSPPSLAPPLQRSTVRGMGWPWDSYLAPGRVLCLELPLEGLGFSLRR